MCASFISPSIRSGFLAKNSLIRIVVGVPSSFLALAISMPVKNVFDCSCFVLLSRLRNISISVVTSVPAFSLKALLGSLIASIRSELPPSSLAIHLRNLCPCPSLSIVDAVVIKIPMPPGLTFFMLFVVMQVKLFRYFFLPFIVNMNIPKWNIGNGQVEGVVRIVHILKPMHTNIGLWVKLL